MTEYQLTHPLTDAKLHDEYGGYLEEGWCNSIYCPDDMRAVADWQLAQCLQFVLLNYGQEAMVPFMEAMRPTQEDN